MKINNIIFDLGGVLIDWNPDYVFLNEFQGNKEKMKEFYNKVCTFDWNENQDAGYPLKKATEDRIKLFPEYENLIQMYYGRWEEMLGGAIEDSVSILKKIVKNTNYKVIALTNWSAETFPIALKRYDFLHWFEGIVVSGTEKTRKPFKKIYYLYHFLTGGFKSKKINVSFYGKKSRVEIVKKIIRLKNYNSYLEIGTFKDELFNSVKKK